MVGIGRCGVANRDAGIDEGLKIRMEISGVSARMSQGQLGMSQAS